MAAESTFIAVKFPGIVAVILGSLVTELEPCKLICWPVYFYVRE